MCISHASGVSWIKALNALFSTLNAVWVIVSVKLIRLLNTTTFRVAFVYTVIFFISCSLLILYFYWNTAGVMAQQTDTEIKQELVYFERIYRRGGVGRVVRAISERSRDPRLSIYLLLDPEGVPLAGNLSGKPIFHEVHNGWVSFAYQRYRQEGAVAHHARGRFAQLPFGFSILVGRDVEDLENLNRLVFRASVYGLGFILVLGIVGGVLISRNFRRRIDSINTASREIMEGDLSRRVPLQGTADEIDQLAKNLNTMLDRIESLMVGMREVTDNVAHDLRSPITRLRNRLEVSLLKPLDKKKTKEILQSTIDEADEMLATFNAILSLARLESGMSGVVLEVEDLRPLLLDATEFVSPVAEESGFTFTVNVPEEAVMVKASHPVLSQAVVNVLENALKYGRGEEAFLALSLVLEEDCAVIRIEDRGVGITEKDRTRVTERFVRLDTARSESGSGLGLSLVLAIVGFHNGTLQLFDNEPQGLAVEIRLPLAT